jgi:glycosyltransferase involved in cell wall biosynthesis
MLTIQIIESFGAGTLQVVQALTTSFDKVGWNTTIFHGTRAETPPDFRSLFPTATRFETLDTGRAINPVADFRDALRIAEYAKKNNASILHGHSSKGGALARISAMLADRPCLYSPHGFSFLSAKGARRTKPTFWAERILAQLPARIVCCSKSEYIIAQGLTSRAELIPNFVSEFDVSGLGPPREGPAVDVVNVGRMSRQKDPARFMDVARALPHLSFLWIGGPASELDGDVPPNVEITGWVDRQCVHERMLGATVFLSTSLYEGMPLSILEAQALGLAVVSTPAPGSRDVVIDGVTGRLAEGVDGLAQAIVETMNDGARRNQYVAAARQQLRLEHSEALLLDKWKALYLSEVKRPFAGAGL